MHMLAITRLSIRPYTHITACSIKEIIFFKTNVQNLEKLERVYDGDIDCIFKIK